MKLWQFLLLQATLLGVFIYFMFIFNQEETYNDFLQDSKEFHAVHQEPPTSHPNITQPTQPKDPKSPDTRPPLPPKKDNATEPKKPIQQPDLTPRPEGFLGGSPIAMRSVNSTSIKGTAEKVDVIFKSKGSSGNRCGQSNQRAVTLCKLGFDNNCKRREVSEELSSWWMMCPIYTANNNQTENLYYLHRNFRNYIKSFGINFQTVEVIFPNQTFQLTEPNNEPYDLQYHNDWIFAMRENLVNVGIKHLPADWQYMSWIDQHIFWVDPYWFEKCILAFNKYNIVHMLNGNDFWNLKNTTDYHLDGFARLWTEVGMGFERHDPRQCGLAWGMRRDIFEALGGLLDICIGTKCDLYQNYAYAGRRYTAQTSGGDYAQMIGEWQDHAIKVYDKKLGFVDTKVVHFMHCYGACKTSEYNLHVWALIQHQYNPKKHIERDQEGRMSLVNNKPLALQLWNLYGGPPRED